MKKIVAAILMILMLLSMAVIPANADETEQITFEGFVFERLRSGSLKLIKYTKDASGKTINIPSNVAGSDVERIGEFAFRDCKMINVTIPETVKMIDAFAFHKCAEIQKITIPNSVYFIDGNPFTGCIKLVNISLDPKHPTLRATRDGILYTKNLKNKTLLSYPCSKKEHNCTIEEDTVFIGNNAFWGCDQLESITVPSMVQEIGKWAFIGCVNLKEVYLPESLLYIGEEAFHCCKALKSVSIPRQITRIEFGTFLNCTSLEKVTFKENLTVICEDAFKGCVSLQEIHLPARLNTIGKKAFYGCSSLITANIPFSVTSIGEAAFDNCSVKLYVTVSEYTYGEIYAKQNILSISPEMQDYSMSDVP